MTDHNIIELSPKELEEILIEYYKEKYDVEIIDIDFKITLLGNQPSAWSWIKVEKIILEKH